MIPNTADSGARARHVRRPLARALLTIGKQIARQLPQDRFLLHAAFFIAKDFAASPRYVSATCCAVAIAAPRQIRQPGNSFEGREKRPDCFHRGCGEIPIGWAHS